jgi:hypothetical protein
MGNTNEKRENNIYYNLKWSEPVHSVSFVEVVMGIWFLENCKEKPEYELTP